MVSIRFASVLAVATMALRGVAADPPPEPSQTVKNPITTPTVILAASAMTDIGCFETGVPLENHGHFQFRSPGNCQLVCLELGKDVMGLSDGENCWCGDLIPPKDSKVNNSTCGTTCRGDDTSLCGGKNKLWVVLTGNTRNPVDFYDPKESSSSVASSTAKATSAAAPTSTSAASASATPSSTPKDDDKPNTIAIAVGVVVGLLALAAILLGVWFLMRRRRQKQAEDDYRRNAANVNAFVNGGKLHTSNSSMNDSRLDPSFVDRRQSNGSIADNEDYSRRILKVTNV